MARFGKVRRSTLGLRAGKSGSRKVSRVGKTASNTGKEKRKGGRSRIAGALRSMGYRRPNKRGAGRMRAVRTAMARAVGGAMRGRRTAGTGRQRYGFGSRGFTRKGTSRKARTDRYTKNACLEADSRGQIIEVFVADIAVRVTGFSWNGTLLKSVRSTAPSINEAAVNYNAVLVVLQEGESIDAALTRLAVPYISTTVEGVSTLQLTADQNDLGSLQRGTKRQRIGNAPGESIVTAIGQNNNNTMTNEQNLDNALQNRAQIQPIYQPQDDIIIARSGAVQWTEGTLLATQFNMSSKRTMWLKRGDRLCVLAKSSTYLSKISMNGALHFNVIN